METIAGVLEHFGHFKAGLFHGSDNTFVEVRGDVAAPRGCASDCGQLSIVKIMNRAPFTEKFRIKTNVKISVDDLLGCLTQDRNQNVTHCARQYSATKNHAMVRDLVPKSFADLPCYGLHSFQIKTTVPIAGSPHTDKRNVAIENRFDRIFAGTEAAVGPAFQNDFRQILLDDRTLPGIDHFDFVSTDIDS